MNLKGKKFLILVENEYEDLELQYPKYRMLEEGAKVVIAGPKEKETYKGKHGYPCVSDIGLDEVQENEYDALILSGGYAPDKLRRNPKAIQIVKQFNFHKKLIAFICHAGWLPISANIIKGVKCTSWISIKDDMINAGAIWVDQAVVVDKNFISSRSPADLPHFCPAIIQYIMQGGKIKQTKLKTK